MYTILNIVKWKLARSMETQYRYDEVDKARFIWFGQVSIQY